MARIVLSVTTDTSKALKGISTLKTQITSLAEQLSKLKVNKDLTAQITQLTKYYQSLASAGKLVAEQQAKEQQALAKTAQEAKSVAANIETLRKGYANLISQLKSLEKQYPEKTFDKTKNSIKSAFENVKDLAEAYQQNNSFTKAEKEEALELSNAYKVLSADVAQLKAENEKLAVADPFATKAPDNIARLQKRFASLLNTIQSISKYYPTGTFDDLTNNTKAFAAEVDNLSAAYKTNGGLSKSELEQLNKLNTAVLEQEAAFAKTRDTATNFHGTLRDLISGFLKFQVSAMLVMKPLQLMQSALQSINETLVNTETVVVSLQRVLDEEVGSQKISTELYNIAVNLGQTFENVQEVAQNFAKAGLTWEETLEATKAGVLALNVAELTAEESSEGLIAVMQQFNYEASQLTYVIDVLNKAADKSAVDTQELLVALQKTGSYAAAANLSLEETVSLISAMSEATAASGQNIGNALKSLFAYTSKSSSLETFASLSEDMKAVVDAYQIGDASILDVWEKLSQTMQNLTSEQATLLSQWSENSGLETELGAELSDVYDQMTGIYDTAGTYRKNYFIALLNNFDEVQNVMGEISDAAGYTNEEQAKYMDTYEAKLNTLQSKWEKLITDESGWLDFKKFWLDVGSAVLDVVNYFGGLQTVVLALSTALWAVFGNKIISAIKTFGKSIADLITGFKAAASGAATLGTAIQSALGIIGLIATAISAIVGAVKNSAEELKQLEEEALESAKNNWDAISEQADKLSQLYSEYKNLNEITNKTTEQDKEWANIQSEIIDLLGTKAIELANLTEGTEAYREKIEELTKEQLQYYALVAQAAANAAQKTFDNSTFDSSFEYYVGKSRATDKDGFYYESTEYAALMEAARQAGFDIARDYIKTYSGSKAPYKVYDSLKLSGNVFAQTTQLEEFAQWLKDNNYGETDLFNEIVAAMQERTESINSLLDSVSSSEYYNYISENGFIDSQADFDSVVSKIMEATGATEDWRSEIEGIVSELSGFNKEIDDGNEKLDDQIKKIETLKDDTLKELVDYLKEIRDLQDETAEIADKQTDIEEKKADIEEKRKDLLEAQAELLEKQKQLEDTQANRKIWKFNSQTGQFDWVTDEKAVLEAQEEVESAQEDVNNAQNEITDAETALEEAIKEFGEWIGDNAQDQVINALDEGNATNESIKEILDKWKAIAEQQNVTDISWYQEIINAIKEKSGVDITQNANSSVSVQQNTGGSGASGSLNKKPVSQTSHSFVYDNGGIAKGLGYLAKATQSTESVNNPALTAKILTPTTNEQFDRYVKDMGIMFENAREYAAMPPVMTKTTSTVTNINHDNGITINGITIGKENLDRPLNQILSMIGLVPN